MNISEYLTTTQFKVLFCCPQAILTHLVVLSLIFTVGKPTILVVLHHTVDRNQVVAESRRLVNNPNVHLTVDVLLRKGKMMNCKQNRTMWREVQAFLAESYRSHGKKVMTSFTDVMQSDLHIINFPSELTILLQSIVTHVVVLLSLLATWNDIINGKYDCNHEP